MRLAVLSPKVAWPSEGLPSGQATDVGFPFQMQAISGLFDETRLLVRVVNSSRVAGDIPLSGRCLSVVPRSLPGGSGYGRKLMLPVWLIRNLSIVVREIREADAV